MKNTFIIYLLASIFSVVIAQDSYHVIKIKGKVSRNGQRVKQGQKLNSSDRIKFLTPGSLLLVSSQRFGRKVLSGNPTQKNDSEIAYMVKRLVSKNRASVRGFIASKESEKDNSMLDYFDKDKHLVLGNEERIAIDKKKFVLNQNSFFLLKYQHEGKTIEQKIPSEASQLIFNQKIIHKEVADYELIYQKEGSKQKLGSLKLAQLADKSKGKKAIDKLVRFMRKGKLEKSKVKENIQNYLTKYFGTPNDQQYNRWFKTNYNF